MDEEQNIQQNTELEEAKKQAEEYLNNWKRERADFINYKKDEDQRRNRALEFGKRVVIEDILDINDGLEKVISDGDPNDDYIVAVKTIKGQLERLFRTYQVEKIKTSTEFDPNIHEAVEMETGGEKMQEIRAGYTMNGEVIRPARVKIVK
jgi:molecular chaperone GrpE